MTEPPQLVQSRARTGRRYAMFPLAGYPTSRSPIWNNTEIRVLTAPAMGAAFVQHHLTMAAGGSGKRKSDGRVESFIYVLTGRATLKMPQEHTLLPGGFAFLPHTSSFELTAAEPTTALLLHKVYEPADGIKPGEPIVSNEKNVPAETWMNNPSSRLQTLIPDDLRYDLSMNIFTFDPGHGLPYVETHVMEHGLLFLEGKGTYYLDGDTMETEKDDFIWMGPYCPQTYLATGPTATRYIYYKNVNREVLI